LAVTGKQQHICVLICGHETRIFKVTRSESVIQHIINAERYFWECVEKDIPPEADASESAAKACNYFIQNMYHSVPLIFLKIASQSTV
jgi:predicted phage-related endonuclease